ncbi:MAG: alkylation response protein AidB-like acyl-CoA dehydrogenase [Saprospiraceae bacterium]|jgi:alkylation response protein AidB-like acyl-CoA dehydrogenase
MSEKTTIRGGEFLIKESDFNAIFIAEEWSEEQKMIADTCRDFLDAEVIPNLDRIDAMEEGLMPSLVEKAGELGLLAISIPEEYQGFGKGFNESTLISEALGSGHSFAVAFSAHTGIGTLPIMYYGTEAQKAKYLPDLGSGVKKACYCLTEPGSGSDANSGKTKAMPSSDGSHYLLNGQKMWITNGGFADIFIVFAKIEDDKNLSAFIVEKDFGGISLNPEEQKMGIKGSSTRQVFFNDVKVPSENLLGDREGGFKIALNILNIGRIKLAAAALGASKTICSTGINYANERIQFGKAISSFGAIQHKIAEQAIQTFVLESSLYRTGQLIDDATDALLAGGMETEKAKLKGVEEYAVEAAILKVQGSEVLDYVADEGVQIYGGMGYSADAPMERSYRDSRINRIFEGTNEINRMLIVDMLIKKAMKGQLDLMGPAQAVGKELMGIPSFGDGEEGTLVAEGNYLKNFKKAVLMVAGGAVQKLMMKLGDEQEVLMNISDMIIQLYSAESAYLRVMKLMAKNGEENCLAQISVVQVFINDAADKISVAGKNALNGFAQGDEARMMFMGLKRFTKTTPFNAIKARRSIAKMLIEENKYKL